MIIFPSNDEGWQDEYRRPPQKYQGIVPFNESPKIMRTVVCYEVHGHPPFDGQRRFSRANYRSPRSSNRRSRAERLLRRFNARGSRFFQRTIVHTVVLIPLMLLSPSRRLRRWIVVQIHRQNGSDFADCIRIVAVRGAPSGDRHFEIDHILGAPSWVGVHISALFSIFCFGPM
jgi:hypothetical protein